MAKQKLEKAFEDWCRAEEKFAKALEPLTKSEPGKLKKDAALDLAELRAKADSRMDTYFKRALS